jgi:polyisoprenoid-binding protein YceI
MMIRHIALLITVLCMTMSLLAQSAYKPQDDSSSVEFKIKNFGIPVSGALKGLKGSIQFDPQKPGADTFTVSVAASSINTGIDMRDSHLKKEDYLSADAFPLLSFTSTKVTSSTKEGYLFIFGNLTIRGVTKPISFPFQALPSGKGYIFTGSFSISRKDFGVGGGSISMNDMVNVTLKVLALPSQ